jgi:hypothetical protein
MKRFLQSQENNSTNTGKKSTSKTPGVQQHLLSNLPAMSNPL